MGRKKKVGMSPNDNSFGDIDEEDSDDSHTNQSNPKYNKHNHSEIEKRRRDKMNTFIVELSALIPMCNAMNRKLDKLTVLRMAVQHMNFLKGSSKSYSKTYSENSIISESDLKQIVLNIADGFLLAVSCDRARILYCSKSVSDVLDYSQQELIGQSWFDILHPDDIFNIKEQLSTSNTTPRERLIDAKTMLPVKTEFPKSTQQLCSGTRRSFYCRMRLGYKTGLPLKERLDVETRHTYSAKRKKTEKHFTVIHCNGYVKSFSKSSVNLDDESEQDGLGCLVVIGRKVKNASNPNKTGEVNESPISEYNSRLSVDGKFQYIDNRAVVITGFLPQELIGTSVYEYYHKDDVMYLAEIHRQVLQSNCAIQTRPYKFKSNFGNHVILQSTLFSFHNPFTKDVEYIVSTDRHISETDLSCANATYSIKNPGVFSRDKFFPFGSVPQQSKNMSGMSTSVFSECSGLETAIAEADSSSGKESSSVDIPIPHVNTNPRKATSSRVASTSGNKHLVASDYTLWQDVIQEQKEDMQKPNNDGNDESALAFVMSLLEADAGLGGPIDFSDLPWPL